MYTLGFAIRARQLRQLLLPHRMSSLVPRSRQSQSSQRQDWMVPFHALVHALHLRHARRHGYRQRVGALSMLLRHSPLSLTSNRESVCPHPILCFGSMNTSVSPCLIDENRCTSTTFSILRRAFCSRVRSMFSCTFFVFAALTRSASCVFLNASSSACTSFAA